MVQTQLATFDTYKLIKRLESKGAETELAKEIVDAIQEGRMLELSALVSRNDFYKFKDEFHEFKEEFYTFREESKEKFAKLENEILLIQKELTSLDNKIEGVKKELKKDLETTKSELKKEISLNAIQLEVKMVRWIVGLLSPIYISILVVLIRWFFVQG